jgi:streptogramin lyase
MTRLRNFPEEVYTLLPTDNLTKLLKVLLGDSGAGQLRKFANQARLGAYLQGANFYDLDNFYGALFNITRTASEKLPLNPYTDLGTADTWASVRAFDASFRSRIDQLGKAISFGPSAIGMELVAEAILQVPCSIYESWRLADIGDGSWAALETYDWSSLEDYTWAELEELSATDTEGYTNRRIFTVVPHRPITLAEDFALRKVLNILKPVDAVLLIDDAGFSTATPVTLRGVYADSTYWDLIQGVIPNPAYTDFYNLDSEVLPGGFREVLRPSFTEYQGEQITYGADIIGVSAYDRDAAGNITANQVIDAYTFQDGSTLYYPPSLGIAPRFFSLSGRYVSDAILQGAPYSNDPSNTPNGIDNPLMDLYVDGQPIDSLITALNVPGNVNALGINAPGQRFWSTPPRLNSDPTIEVLDIHLVASRLVNNLTFAIAHYPQLAQVETFDPSTGQWNTIWSQKIYDSVPSVLPLADAVLHEHPQHPPENWDTFTLNIPPTVMSEIRIVLQRIPNGRPPVSTVISTSPSLNGGPPVVSTPVPYSLGVQNFALGYNISQEADLPAQNITTTDALGSQVQFIPRFEVADNAINGGTIPWRCAPQPTSDSVVNFYVDTRDQSGNAQLINQIFLDPLYLGPHCTVYFSDESTASLGFPAEATYILPPDIMLSPNEGIYPPGIAVPYVTGLVFESITPSAVAIENLAVQFNPAESWWMSVELRPNFASIAADSETIVDLGNGMALYLNAIDGVGCLGLAFNDYAVVAGVPYQNNAEQLVVGNISYSAGQTIVATVAYFAEATNEFGPGLYLFYNGNNPTVIEQANLSEGRIVEPDVFPIFSSLFSTGGWSAKVPGPALADYPLPTQIWFGDTETNFDLPPANMTIIGIVLKQTALSYTDFTQFPTNTNAYTTVGGAATANAILYFNMLNVTDANPYGFCGGPGDFYELLTWTPIMRDYVVTKGFMEFNPVSAKFFKLEFTNLVAQTLPTLFPITKKTKQHFGLGSGVVQEPQIPALGNPGSSVQGTPAAISLASEIYFEDSNIVGNPLLDQSPTIIQPTTVQTAQDIATQTLLANSAWFWQYQEFAVASTAPRFINTEVHTYNESTIVQTGQVSYFVGLNKIAIYRLDPSAQDDTRIYDESFLDEAYIATSGIPHTPGDVNTFDVSLSDLPKQDVSVPYNSSTPVYGVQFATVQSDPIQIAWDDDFTDPAIQPPYRWTGSTGDSLSPGPPVSQPFRNQPSLLGDATLLLQPNQTVLVTRDSVTAPPPGPSFDGIVDPVVYPIMEEIFTIPEVIGLTPDVATYNSQPGSEAPGYLGTGIQYGGIGNAQADTPLGGVVYAAARISTNDVLTTPLFLEIIDIDTSTVVAQIEVNCAPNQTVEVYTSYVLGTQVTAGGPVVSRIVQYGGAKNSWIVDRLSTFVDAWEWEFSVDGGTNWVTAVSVRNNAYGMITFPQPGTELLWRVTGWAPGLHLHWLRIRPVYNGVLKDEPLGVVQGPNQTVFDQSPPINQDPFFSGWSKPIPFWWFRASSDFQVLPAPGAPHLGPYGNVYIRDETDMLTESDSVDYNTVLTRETEDTLELTTSNGGTNISVETLTTEDSVNYSITRASEISLPSNLPQGIAITPDGSLLCVACELDPQFVVLDTASKSTHSDSSLDDGTGLISGVVSPDGTTYYALDSYLNQIYQIELTPDIGVLAQQAYLGWPNGPFQAVISPDGSTLYVSDGNGTMHLINTVDLSEASSYAPATDTYIQAMVLSLDGTKLYALTNTGHLYVLDPATGISSADLLLDSGTNIYTDLKMSPDGAYLWAVAPYYTNQLAKIQTSDLTLVWEITLALPSPATIAVDPGSLIVWVADQSTGSIEKLDALTGDLITTVNSGSTFTQPMVVGTDGTLYAADYGNSDVYFYP